MTAQERLWLNGFTTVGQAFAHERLALEEVRQALEEQLAPEEPWMAPWQEGFRAGVRAGFGN
jgi:hypothetical protein